MYDFVCLQCKGDGTREQGWRMCIDLPLAFCLYEQYWCVASGIRAMRTEETYPSAVIFVYLICISKNLINIFRFSLVWLRLFMRMRNEE